MKRILQYIIVFLAGIGLGLLLSGNRPATSDIQYTVMDTTINEVVESSWVFPPIQEQEIHGEILQDNTSAVQDSIHRITFTVDEGVADIEYNIQTRQGTLVWTPAPVLREHVYTYETINYKEPIPLQEPTYFHKLSYVGGFVTGCVATVGFIYLVGAVL